jgi:hypothetical protein
MQNQQEVVTKTANYLNIKFTEANREYQSPLGSTIYVPRKIEDLGFHKTAFIGPAVDLSLLGYPSYVGHKIGKSEARLNKLTGEKKKTSLPASMLGHLMLPGYTGYAAGKRKGYKTAALRMGDIEDHMGTFFNDKEEVGVRQMIGHQKAKRFALRHPWLTGIPTLGIAPAVSHANAVNEITRNLVRKDSKLRQTYQAHHNAIRARQLEEARMSIERDKANAIPNAVSEAAAAYLGGKRIEYDTQ